MYIFLYIFSPVYYLHIKNMAKIVYNFEKKTKKQTLNVVSVNPSPAEP